MTASGAFAGWMGVSAKQSPGEVLHGMLGTGGEPLRLLGEGAAWSVAAVGTVPEFRLEKLDGGGAMLLAGEVRIAGHAAPVGVRELQAAPVLGEAGPGGSFLLLRIDTAAGGVRLEAVTDRFASYPFFYAEVCGGIAFGSAPSIVARHPSVSDELSVQSVFDFLYLTALPLPETAYVQVRGLEPGTSVVREGGRTRHHTWWRPAFSPRPLDSGDHAHMCQRLRDGLLQAVRADLTDSSGCFLSGGLDSSSIVGMAREAGGKAPDTYSIGFADEDYNELEYARLVARHFGANHHEYFVTPEDVIELLPVLARSFGQPFGNASVVPTFHCALLAREHGVDRLLAGDGGDELFGGNERYAEQLLFELYGHLPRWLRSSVIEPLTSLVAPLDSIPLARKAASYVRQAAIPLPERLERYNYLRHLGAQTILPAPLLSAVDQERPLSLKRDVFTRVQADADINRMLGLDFKFTLSDSDLPKVRTMCAQAGVEVRFPFLNDALVDFAAQLPVQAKVTPKQLRVFFKQAFRGFLPDQVIAKRKHGFGLPFGPWLTSHARLRDLAYERLDAAARRGIVNGHFVKELQDRLLAEHARYYGPLVWNLVILESWMEENHAQVSF